MKLVLNILRGAVIGLANIIPGVSGGTMMVSMGIYDTLIYCINHLFKEFKKCFMTLLPYLVGMVIAIIAGAFGLKWAFAQLPLPTNFLFIGLILGSLPMLLKELKGTMPSASQKTIGGGVFLLFFALVVILKVVEAENSAAITLNLVEIIKLFFLGTIASATMVIPGVSGSMMLKTLGYYEPVVTVAIPNTIHALTAGDWAGLFQNIGILIPFALGIVFGIFAIAKLIEVLLRRWKGFTYCGILGMVAASPVVILMNKALYATVNVWLVLGSVVALAAGWFIAAKLGVEEPTKN